MISLIHQESLSILLQKQFNQIVLFMIFYDYDPYQLAANNAKALKDHIEQKFNFKVQSTGVIYFSDGTVNIIQGSEERDKYVDTVSTKSSLRRIISGSHRAI